MWTTLLATTVHPMPTIIGFGAGSASATSPFNVAYPSSIQADDMIILVVDGYANDDFELGDASWGLTTPTDFLALDDGSGVVSSRLLGPVGSQTITIHTMRLVYKKATGSETGNLSVAFTASGTVVGAKGRMMLVRGAHLKEGYGENFTNATGTTIAPVSLTTTGPNRLALTFFSGLSTSTIGDISGETGGDWTEATAEYTNATTFSAFMQVQSAQLTNAGTLSGGTATLGTSSTQRLAATIALYG